MEMQNKDIWKIVKFKNGVKFFAKKDEKFNLASIVKKCKSIKQIKNYIRLINRLIQIF